MQTISMTMQDMLHASRSKPKTLALVEHCLAYPDMTPVPPAFNRMAHTDFAILSETDDDLEWDDYCPAYALGLLTFKAYCRESAGRREAELKGQWDDLRGSSRLGWEQARPIIARSWNALSRLERDGMAHARAAVPSHG